MKPNKTDPELGAKVQAYLVEKGVHTPMKIPFSHDVALTSIADYFAGIMRALGLDLEDDSLCGTPNRVAKMYVDEAFYGLNPDTFPKCTAVDNKMSYDEMVTITDINLQSNCEHHFVVISGVCHIAYIPKDKVLGLSKFNRIVEYFSKRPQIQERLTEQVFYALELILGTSDIAVMMNAEHFCVKSRGVQDINSRTTTTKLGGIFKDSPVARKEFLSLVR